MFQDPHMIYKIAKQKQEMLLAEIENKQRYQSAMVPIVKKRPLGQIMLKIARLFIGIGISMERRWGNLPGGAEDVRGEKDPRAV